MQQPPQFTESTLRTYTESLRRQLFDAAVRLIWEPASPEEHVPGFSPDASGLMVVYAFGRWLAVWTDLEEPEDAAPDRRTQMVRIIASADTPYGIVFSEI